MHLMAADPGLVRRFPTALHLEDYTPVQLAAIARQTAHTKYGLAFGPALEARVATLSLPLSLARTLPLSLARTLSQRLRLSASLSASLSVSLRLALTFTPPLTRRGWRRMWRSGTPCRTNPNPTRTLTRTLPLYLTRT